MPSYLKLVWVKLYHSQNNLFNPVFFTGVFLGFVQTPALKGLVFTSLEVVAGLPLHGLSRTD